MARPTVSTLTARAHQSQAWIEKLLYLASPILLILAWELAGRTNIVDTRFFGLPSEIAHTFRSMLESGELLSHLRASLTRILLGFAIGALAGATLGCLMGFSRTIRAGLLPIVAALFPIPKLAVLPLLLLVFGVGQKTAISLVAIGVFFVQLFATMDGVINLPHSYREVSAAFGASRSQFVRIVALPGALPSILTGLKLSMGIALLLIVAAEFVGTRVGIGYLIWSSWEVFAVEKMYVGLVVLALLGFITNIGLEQMERRLIPGRR
ncbi:MAG: ABC transporter permease [Acidimicrobiia bacterium]